MEVLTMDVKALVWEFNTISAIHELRGRAVRAGTVVQVEAE